MDIMENESGYQSTILNKTGLICFKLEFGGRGETTFTPTNGLTMQILPNWKAGFLLRLVGPVKITRLQNTVAILSNRQICGR